MSGLFYTCIVMGDNNCCHGHGVQLKGTTGLVPVQVAAAGRCCSAAGLEPVDSTAAGMARASCLDQQPVCLMGRALQGSQVRGGAGRGGYPMLYTRPHLCPLYDSPGLTWAGLLPSLPFPPPPLLPLHLSLSFLRVCALYASRFQMSCHSAVPCLLPQVLVQHYVRCQGRNRPGRPGGSVC